MGRRRKIPFIRMVEAIGGPEVRIFFSNGRVVEMVLPVTDARKARVVDEGMGLDPGDGRGEISAADLAAHRGRVFHPGRGRYQRGRAGTAYDK